MCDAIMAEIARNCQETNQLIVQTVENLGEQVLKWRSNNTTMSIAFHVWHLARWADFLQAGINGDEKQIWDKENLSAQWGFGDAGLGYAETGMGMDDDVSMSLQFPEQCIVVDYARRAFAQADQAVTAIRDDQFYCETVWEGYSLGSAVLVYLTHANRHLGMIECMLGVQGQRGSARD